MARVSQICQGMEPCSFDQVRIYQLCSQVRIRPNRRGSRPRSKERPRHADAKPAWVITVDRGWEALAATTVAWLDARFPPRDVQGAETAGRPDVRARVD